MLRGTNITGVKVVNHPRTQLNDALIASEQVKRGPVKKTAALVWTAAAYYQHTGRCNFINLIAASPELVASVLPAGARAAPLDTLPQAGFQPLVLPVAHKKGANLLLTL